MMRENHKTKSSEYIFICQGDLYIASTTPEEILHKLQDKYKINIYLESNFPHDPGGTNICQLKEYLGKLYANVNKPFKDKLPRDLCIAFEINKLFIRKGNLNLIHISKIHFNISMIYQEEENWRNYRRKCNHQSFIHISIQR